MNDMDAIEIPVCSGPVHGTMTPPGSKSITNRALVCAALAEGQTTLLDVLDSEDTRVMIHAWQKVGIDIQCESDFSRVVVQGCLGALPKASVATPLDIFVQNSGTSIRFLAAALAACGGKFRLDGIPRMRQRPIGDLGQALRKLGANVTCRDQLFPPVMIDSDGLTGGFSEVAGDLSSQFLSGLLMAAPLAAEPVTLGVSGELVSRPYVDMTCQVMKSFGVDVLQTPGEFQIRPQKYQGRTYKVEPDASAASYFWAIAAITGGDVTVAGLDTSSLQGDVGFVECLKAMGCQVEYKDRATRVVGGRLHGIDVNMNSISDTVQTLAAVALFADGTTTIHGVAHNRHKETDRIEDLATELRRMGATVETFADGLSITPSQLKPTQVQTYNDHRMAMSLSLVGLRQSGIVIQNPSCTQKTYPKYFEDLFAFISAANG